MADGVDTIDAIETQVTKVNKHDARHFGDRSFDEAMKEWMQEQNKTKVDTNKPK
jgi:hypothetical protein